MIFKRLLTFLIICGLLKINLFQLSHACEFKNTSLEALDYENQSHLEALNNHIGDEYNLQNYTLAPTDRFQKNKCLEELNCIDKIKFLSIASELADLENNNSLTKDRAQNIINNHLQGSSPQAKARVMSALASEALQETLPYQEIENFYFLKETLSQIDHELRTVKWSAQKFQDLMDEMQSNANSGSFLSRVWYQASTSIELAASNAFNRVEETELYKKAREYRLSIEALKQKLEDVLASQSNINEDTKDSVREFINTQTENTTNYLQSEIQNTHQAIDQTRQVAMLGATALLAGGLTVAAVGTLGPAIFPGLMQVAGTGAVASLVANGGAFGTASALAIEGAGITSGINILSRLHELYINEDNSSLYCKAIEQEMLRGGTNLVGEAALSGGMTAIFGGGMLIAATRAGTWSKVAGLGLVAGMTSYGGVQIYSSHQSKIKALNNLRHNLTSPEDIACLDEAISNVNYQTSFDVTSFILEMAIPSAVEIKLKNQNHHTGNLSESSVRGNTISDDIPSDQQVGENQISYLNLLSEQPSETTIIEFSNLNSSNSTGRELHIQNNDMNTWIGLHSKVDNSSLSYRVTPRINTLRSELSKYKGTTDRSDFNIESTGAYNAFTGGQKWSLQRALSLFPKSNDKEAFELSVSAMEDQEAIADYLEDLFFEIGISNADNGGKISEQDFKNTLLNRLTRANVGFSNQTKTIYNGEEQTSFAEILKDKRLIIDEAFRSDIEDGHGVYIHILQFDYLRTVFENYNLENGTNLNISDFYQSIGEVILAGSSDADINQRMNLTWVALFDFWDFGSLSSPELLNPIYSRYIDY